MVHNLSTRFFFPSSMTFLNSGRLARRSVFLKEKSSIHSAWGQRVMTYQTANTHCPQNKEIIIYAPLGHKG